MYLLDTDTCSYILKNHSASVRSRFKKLHVGDLAVSEITAAELYYGAQRHAQRGAAIRADIDDFLSRLRVLPWQGMREYAQLRYDLESKGMPIGNMDLLIGSHALNLGATLVTNNLAHFRRVAGLTCENWV